MNSLKYTNKIVHLRYLLIFYFLAVVSCFAGVDHLDNLNKKSDAIRSGIVEYVRVTQLTEEEKKKKSARENKAKSNDSTRISYKWKYRHAFSGQRVKLEPLTDDNEGADSVVYFDGSFYYEHYPLQRDIYIYEKRSLADGGNSIPFAKDYIMRAGRQLPEGCNRDTLVNGDTEADAKNGWVKLEFAIDEEANDKRIAVFLDPSKDFLIKEIHFDEGSFSRISHRFKNQETVGYLKKLN